MHSVRNTMGKNRNSQRNEYSEVNGIETKKKTSETDIVLWSEQIPVQCTQLTTTENWERLLTKVLSKQTDCWIH